ncbi:uncharacterized protein LOC144153563 [Haemaphysalis longicornis]
MSQVVASGWEGPGWSPALVAEVQLEILGPHPGLFGRLCAAATGLGLSRRHARGGHPAGAAVVCCILSHSRAGGCQPGPDPSAVPCNATPGWPCCASGGRLVLSRGAWSAVSGRLAAAAVGAQTQGAQGQRTSDVISAPNRAESSSQPSCAPCGFQAEKHHLEVADSPACWPWRVARFNNREARRNLRLLDQLLLLPGCARERDKVHKVLGSYLDASGVIPTPRLPAGLIWNNIEASCWHGQHGWRQEARTLSFMGTSQTADDCHMKLSSLFTSI